MSRDGYKASWGRGRISCPVPAHIPTLIPKIPPIPVPNGYSIFDEVTKEIFNLFFFCNTYITI